MKKRIAIEDKEDWSFESSESAIYYNDRIVYPEVKSLTFIKLEEKNCGPAFDLSEIALPNLEEIMILNESPGEKWMEPAMLIKKLKKESFCNVKSLGISDYENTVELMDWVKHCKNLESVELAIPKNVDLPMELNEATNLVHLKIRESLLSEIPDVVFSLKKLEKIDLDRSSIISVIPDEIKNLTKLKSFSLWQSDFSYISPELFKLPCLKELNFSYTSYKNPTVEVFDAIKYLKQKNPDFYTHLVDRVHWFREIWDQV